MSEIPEHYLKEADVLLKSAEHRWGLTLGHMDFSDVSQIIRQHITKKYSLFNPERGKFSTWAKRVISNQISNLKKKNYTRYLNPCQFCHDYNCLEDCPNQNKWSRSKQFAASIHFASSLDEKFDENEDTSRIQISGDILDLEPAINKLHEILLNNLDDRVKEFYQMKYVDGKTNEEIAGIFGFITNETNRIPGYRQIYNMEAEIKILANFVVKTQDIF